MNDQGWIKLHRKISDNHLWLSEPFSRGQAWVDLILLANHKKGIIRARGVLVEVNRGEVGWSEVKLSERWKWSRGKLRRFLKELENEQQIVQQKNNVTSVISITNYETFQGVEQHIVQQAVQQTDSKRYTNKNEKNEKNEKNIIKPKKTKHSFEDSLIFDKNKFKKRFPTWDSELLNHYYNAASEYSGSKGMKYLDWGLAISGWQRREALKQKTNQVNKPKPFSQQEEETSANYMDQINQTSRELNNGTMENAEIEPLQGGDNQNVLGLQ